MSRKLYPLLKALSLPSRGSPARSFFVPPVHRHHPNRVARMTQQRTRVLIIGTGGVGTMSAYALEQGGKAEVRAVMRSNYDTVKKE